MNSGKDTKESGIGRFTGRVMSAWQYVSAGVWSDPRRNWWIKILRTLNLSVQSFLNRDIQSQACAMTYRTMLAWCRRWLFWWP